jgi:hypothetical protein
VAGRGSGGRRPASSVAGITRSFTSFSQAAAENAESRVLAGLHFRSACRDGLRLGEQIGRRAIAHHLQPYQR